MKKSFRDIFSDTVIFLLRPIITFLMKREISVNHEGGIIPRNSEKFILISNHFNTWDSFVVMTYVKKNILMEISLFLFLMVVHI